MCKSHQNISWYLECKNARLDGSGTKLSLAIQRSSTTRFIAENFLLFECFRDLILHDKIPIGDRTPFNNEIVSHLFRDHILDSNLYKKNMNISSDARRYLSGGWLEEYAGLAVAAAGADEVRIGQRVFWNSAGFHGVNEIDTIARFGERVVFISAKALRARFNNADPRQRVRLMDALQEADNLADHFGDEKTPVFLLVTTDLWDEYNNKSRYEQLHGKASALNVSILSLDNLSFSEIVSAFANCSG